VTLHRCYVTETVGISKAKRESVPNLLERLDPSTQPIEILSLSLVSQESGIFFSPAGDSISLHSLCPGFTPSEASPLLWQ